MDASLAQGLPLDFYAPPIQLTEPVDIHLVPLPTIIHHHPPSQVELSSDQSI